MSIPFPFYIRTSSTKAAAEGKASPAVNPMEEEEGGDDAEEGKEEEEKS